MLFSATGDVVMSVEYIPIKDFSDRYREGWRMVPGYDLKAGDYAVLMTEPVKEIESNREAASHSRMIPPMCERQAAISQTHKPKGAPA